MSTLVATTATCLSSNGLDANDMPTSTEVPTRSTDHHETSSGTPTTQITTTIQETTTTSPEIYETSTETSTTEMTTTQEIFETTGILR